MINAYTEALRSLETHAFAGVRCQHGISLLEDCNECEPILDPYFYEEAL
jgi:hypothetical protein